jgi:DNA-directed RNA polymerase specialized sigma24 family protein
MKSRSEQPGAYIEGIATDKLDFADPTRFLRRYAPAIRGYFATLMRNRCDAEDAAQDFFLRIMRQGFPHFSVGRSRFRDYLKTAIRNAARTYMKRTGRPPSDAYIVAALASAPVADQVLDQEFIVHWRWCLLKRVWAALRRHQRSSPGNLFHTVLTLEARYPEEGSAELAARASAVVGYPLQVAAYRKQVSRARRLLARLLVEEVRLTLHQPSDEELNRELMDLGLWIWIQKWREGGREKDRGADDRK